MKLNTTLLQNWLIPVAIIASWEVFGRLGVLPKYLSTPSLVVDAFRELTSTSELAVALATSLYRVAAGFIIGTATGVLAGIGAGLLPSIRNFFDPLVSFLYPVPKIAFLPIFLLLFGLGHASKISIISVSTFFPVFIASRHALMAVNKLLIWSARNMNTPRWTILWRVMIPAAAPELFAGIRIGLAHSFVVLFAAELIGSQAGIGTIISDGEEWGRFDLMFAGIACFGILGFASDRLLMAIRKRVLKGQLIGTEEALTL